MAVRRRYPAGTDIVVPKLIEVDVKNGVTIDGVLLPYAVEEAHVEARPGYPARVVLVLVADEAHVRS